MLHFTGERNIVSPSKHVGDNKLKLLLTIKNLAHFFLYFYEKKRNNLLERVLE